MAHYPYLSTDDADIPALLVTLDTNLPGALATKYGIDDAMLLRIHQGRLVFDWFFHNNPLARQWTQSLTDERDKMFDNPTGGTDAMPDLPALGAIPTITVPGNPDPVAVQIEPGFFEFLGRLVQQIKNDDSYDPADGTLLKIVGAEVPDLDPNIVPDAKVAIGPNGKPVVTCKKTRFQGFTAFVARGNGPMVEIGFSTSRNYVIDLPLPAAGTVEIWKVQYRLKNAPFGQKSMVMEISVMGS